MSEVRIVWLSADGEEREEAWPSIERFRLWAMGEGFHGTWRAYQEDADGEWDLIDEGKL